MHFSETLAKKRNEVTEELTVIESRFRGSSDNIKQDSKSIADKNGDAAVGKQMDQSKSKHDRHDDGPDDDEDDEDEEVDSPYENSDVDDDEPMSAQNRIAPDISIVKQEGSLILSFCYFCLIYYKKKSVCFLIAVTHSPTKELHSMVVVKKVEKPEELVHHDDDDDGKDSPIVSIQPVEQTFDLEAAD